MDGKTPNGASTISISVVSGSQNVKDPPQESWFARNQRTKPQSNSVGAAIFLLMTGGMNIGQSYRLMNTNEIYCWFVAVIMGLVIGALIAEQVLKKFSFFIATLLIVVGGIIRTASCEGETYAPRCFNGLGVGIALIPCLIAAGEEVMIYKRGMVAASTESMSFALGIYLATFVPGFTHFSEKSYNTYMGATEICFGLLTLLFTHFLFVETPVFYLARNNEQAALESLRNLQRPQQLNTEAFMTFNELKLYLAESKEKTFRQSLVSGLPALVKMCFYRGLVAMTYSQFCFDCFATWFRIAYGIARWLAVLVSAMLLDTYGRKKTMLGSIFILTVLALVIAIMDFPYNRCGAFFVVFQIFAGFFVAPSSAYLSEAFPLAAKSYFLAISFAFEMLIAILFIVWRIHVSTYFFIFGAVGINFFSFGIICFPETKQTTLREALKKFRYFSTNT